jgi:hypothetical protein
MDPLPLFLRWEHTTPPHHKFYEVEVELSLFYPKLLTRRCGRLGTRRPRTLQLLIHPPAQLQAFIAPLSRQRQRHGYCLVAQLCEPASAGVAA